MATATLKTYHGNTMADALSQVKKDLGSEAVILHTRSYKVGGVMGVGAREMVEITAAADSTTIMPRRLRPTLQRRESGARSPLPIQSNPTEQHARHEPQAPRRLSPQAHVQNPVLPDGEADSRSTQTPTTPTQSPTPPTPPTKPASGETFIARPPWFQKKQTTAPGADSRRQSGNEAEQNPIPTRLSEDANPGQGAAPDVSRLSAGRVSPLLTNPGTPAALEDELSAIKRLVGQVLQSTRRVEVHTGQAGDLTGDRLQLANRGVLFTLYMKLLDNQVSTEIADRLSASVRESLTSDDLADAMVVREAMLREIARLIPATPQPRPAGREQTARPRVIALLGPTGVGKTTTVAKLAANYKLKYGRRVGLITADTYRIAAVEQLRTYADIVGLPLKVALTPCDMADAIESLGACDIVLVDTAGRSQHDRAKLGELAAFLEAAQPDERHLVLSLGAAESVIVRAAERFGDLGAARVILSKLDEAVDFGVIANIAAQIGLPMSFVTTGQEVPDHIESADASRLARLVLDGSQAWKGLRRND